MITPWIFSLLYGCFAEAMSYNSSFHEAIALQPPLADYGQPVSVQNLFEQEIGNSWNQFYNVNANLSDISFNHVVFTIDFSTFGRQFDRLGHLYFNNIEVWRFSTPEPSGRLIHAAMSKDLSQYVELFKQGGVLTLSLDNVVDGTYTGVLSVSVHAELFQSDNTAQEYSQWWYKDPPTGYESLHPGAHAVSIPPEMDLSIRQVPQNIMRAGLQIFASGASDEEFWYANLVNQTGATRQIHVKINGILAGIVDPFQPEYTGTDNPLWWVTLVGVAAYDLPSYFIDISTFLPILWGDSVKLEIGVVNGYNNETVLNSWIMNVALITWAKDGFIGTGGNQLVINQLQQPKVVKLSDGGSDEVDYIGIDNFLSLTCSLESTTGTIYSEWTQQGKARNVENVQGTNKQWTLSWTQGNNRVRFGSDIYQQYFEYPKGIYQDVAEAGPGTPFGYGGCAYAYIVQNQGANSFVLNNTVATSFGVKPTNYTDGYLGYIQGDGDSAFNHITVNTNGTILNETDSYGGLESSVWESAFDQFEKLIYENDAVALVQSLRQFTNTSVLDIY